jgi:hypothetical protein
VDGVRDASLRATPAGAHSLRLDLSEGADPAEVSRRVARLLQDRMGLDAAMKGDTAQADPSPADPLGLREPAAGSPSAGLLGRRDSPAVPTSTGPSGRRESPAAPTSTGALGRRESPVAPTSTVPLGPRETPAAADPLGRRETPAAPTSTAPLGRREAPAVDPPNRREPTGIDPLGRREAPGSIDPLSRREPAGIDPLSRREPAGIDPLSRREPAGVDPLRRREPAVAPTSTGPLPRREPPVAPTSAGPLGRPEPAAPTSALPTVAPFRGAPVSAPPVPAADAPPVQTAPARRPEPVEAAVVPAEVGNDSPRPLDPGEQPGPRIVIDQVHVNMYGTDGTVEVRLSVGGRTASGVSSGPAVAGYLMRLCATATAAAVDELLASSEHPDGPARCFVEHAAAVPFGNAQVAVVVLLLSCNGWVEQLSGSAVVTGDDRHAMVRATLAAVNRRLEALLSR